MKMSENMEIFTHRRNLLEFENRNRVKIAKKSTFYEIPKWVNKLVENQLNALLPVKNFTAMVALPNK